LKDKNSKENQYHLNYVIKLTDNSECASVVLFAKIPIERIMSTANSKRLNIV